MRAFIIIFALATVPAVADAKPRVKVTHSWDGSVSIKNRKTGDYVWMAPPPADDSKTLHCSTSGKTTTCLFW